MPATTFERQPLVKFIGTAITEPEDTKNGAATKFRFVSADGYGDDANKTFYDVLTKNPDLRNAIKQHVYKGAKLAIEGNEKVDREYNPDKPQYTIFATLIYTVQNIKTIAADKGDDF